MTNPILVRELVEQHAGSTKQIRERLAVEQPHFVPLNLEALKITLGHVITTMASDLDESDRGRAAYLVTSVKKFQSTVIAYVENAHKNRIVISGGKLTANGQEFDISQINNYVPATVSVNNKTIGVLYKNYKTTSANLFSSFLNKEMTRFIKGVVDRKYTAKTVSGESVQYTPGFDVGHIFNPDGTLANTPLAEKFKKMLEALNQISAGTFVGVDGVAVPKQDTVEMTAAKQILNNALNTLAVKSSYGPKIEITLGKQVTEFLTLVNANIVVIQDRFENQYNYGTLIEGDLGTKTINLLLSTNYSRNIYEEIEYRILTTLKTGRKVKNLAVNKKLPTIKVPKSKTKFTATSPTRSSSSIKLKEEFAAGNIISLQNLINQNLAKQIQSNMGTGSATKVLNYRTGRFAESAKVERMSESRQGMITAFYSYMRNPYGTFAEGGAQEFPTSRNPKLLIAQSIRQLAGTQVANRMRAVLV